jgi:hypothetical protein
MPAMIVQNMTILSGKKFGALRPPQLQIANERMGLVSAAE